MEAWFWIFLAAITISFLWGVAFGDGHDEPEQKTGRRPWGH